MKKIRVIIGCSIVRFWPKGALTNSSAMANVSQYIAYFPTDRCYLERLYFEYWMNSQRDFNLNISIITSTDTHEIRFFEFIAPSGLAITSFFRVVEKPNIGIGCVDTYQEALCLIGYPSDKDKADIYSAYLQTIGVDNSDFISSSA